VVFAASTPTVSGANRRQGPDRLREQNARLLARIGRLQAKLQRLSDDNRELRRTLAQVALEHERVTTSTLRRPAAVKEDHAGRVRSMLRDPCSRNP
jgi:hypothetical protein